MPNWNISLGGLSNNVLQASSNSNDRTGLKAGATQTTENSSLTRSVIPNTLVTDTSRQAIQVYTVKSGDTVLGIAARFGLQPETIMWANSQIEQDPDRLGVGDQLNILPVNGVLHIVKQGETLSMLADKYKAKVEDIIGYKGNHLANATAELGVGSQLVIPGGVKEFVQPTYYAETTTALAPDNATKGFGTFSWPSGGTVTQQYWGGHPAIDIASWTGAPVKAADSGYVALASSGAWNTGYGNYIIVDHGNGFTTLYAHLSSIFVKPGENVTRGEQIGLVGSTGHSTGPHLHFEVRYQGVQRNPSSYLP
ncbi:MAG: peptidoglycan DD-metalloendopeptidase family protein [Caldilineaceae bacterium]